MTPQEAADVVAIGQLPIVLTVGHISALAGLGRSVPELLLLAQLPFALHELIHVAAATG